ncbi:glycoside hydrolase family 43 protein [Myriangium duriaei CBS 260.36]|uniref:Glycoside hydrolase family 43 protein n=1 Tax=Myriangium duriaei CBS 260.36 TaxID=1168546 RepID=A0A9P4J9Z1_9PEZI|nr:glycoside hydrolase family 43 protein [Myriangium duriaei CBS 260.36]
MTVYNPICLSLTSQTTPDPYVTYAHNQFYMTFTAGDRVEVWRASSLPDFLSRPEKHVIWRPPPETHYSADLWAPELHALRGRWYVYVAAAHPKHGNRSHRMYVLGGPSTDRDPTDGHWEFLGPIANIDSGQWAIDGTVIELNHQLYFVYSGWPCGETESELTQEIFIVHLSDPVTASSPSTCLCQPLEPWERSDRSGINEGPQFLRAQDGSWTGIVYSCAGSWTKDYKMNTLQYLGGDPLDHRSWNKSKLPLITNNNLGTGPWGPGHGSFIHIGNETFGIYHATDNPHDGWDNRKARMQRVVFRNGQPFMGGKVGPLTSNWAEFIGDSGGHDSHEHQHHGLSGILQKIKNKVKDEL